MNTNKSSTHLIDVINKRNFLIETFLQWKIEYDYLDIPKHVCSPYYVERLFKGFPYELQRTYYYEAENENLRYLLYKLDLVLRKYDLSPIEQVIKSIESEIESKSKMYTIPEQYVVQALQTYEEKYKLLEEKYKSLEENITKKNKLLQETITTKIEQSTLNLKETIIHEIKTIAANAIDEEKQKLIQERIEKLVKTHEMKINGMFIDKTSELTIKIGDVDREFTKHKLEIDRYYSKLDKVKKTQTELKQVEEDLKMLISNTKEKMNNIENLYKEPVMIYNVQNVEDDNLCHICTITKKNMLFFKCKHVYGCDLCINKLTNKRKCPMCNIQQDCDPIKLYF